MTVRFESFEKIIAGIAAPLAGGRPLQPKGIVSAVKRSARESARNYGADRWKEVPNSYSVRISERDWEDYYGARACAVEEWASSRVGEWMLKGGDYSVSLDGCECPEPVRHVRVEIAPDPFVGYGEAEVSARFAPVGELCAACSGDAPNAFDPGSRVGRIEVAHRRAADAAGGAQLAVEEAVDGVADAVRTILESAELPGRRRTVGGIAFAPTRVMPADLAHSETVCIDAGKMPRPSGKASPPIQAEDCSREECKGIPIL